MVDKYEIIDGCRSNFNKYLREAFSHIPFKEGASIVDVGCGSGVSVCEITKHYNYDITVLDSDKNALNILKNKTAEHGYSMSVMEASAEEADLPENNYYVVLAEGLFNVIGFKTGLGIATKLLQHGGYLILHDELRGKEEKLQLFEEYNYEKLAYIVLDEKVWWEDYYACLQRNIDAIDDLSLNNIDEIFKEEILQIEEYKRNPDAFCSIYYVLKKN